MSNIFGFIYNIFGYVLGFIYELFKNTPAPYVISLIVFTVLTRIILLPTAIPQQKNHLCYILSSCLMMV